MGFEVWSKSTMTSVSESGARLITCGAVGMPRKYIEGGVLAYGGVLVLAMSAPMHVMLT